MVSYLLSNYCIWPEWELLYYFFPMGLSNFSYQILFDAVGVWQQNFV